jgi:glycosyltransferase involved in cell wall biosynthesis
MLVSIIIPAYNEEENIALCLGSIFNMDYPDEMFEVIVVDNGSTDKTVEVAEKFKVTLIVDDAKNVSGLRNLGVQVAKGKILAFVDADCIVAREWLKNAEPYFDNTGISAWGAPPIPPENATWVQKAWFVVRKKEQAVQDVGWMESMNLLVRKKIFQDVGGFDESLITCEDVDLCYRLATKGRIVSDERLSVIHLGEAATIKEFVKKESWRGTGNFAGIKNHGLTWKEVPSFGLPVYFAFLLPGVLILYLFSQNAAWFVLFLVLGVLPSGAVLYKVRKKRAGTQIKLGLLLLMQFYFLARTVAVFKNRR